MFPCIFDGMQIVWVILSHEYRCFQCWRHKHSPNHRTFVDVLHCSFWRTVQHLSQSIIYSVQEWSWSYRKVRFCGGVRVHIIDDKLVRYGSHRTCVRHFTRSPHLRRPLVVNVPFWVVWWASGQYGFPRTCLLHIKRAQRYVLTFRFGFQRAFWCNRGKYVRIPYTVSWYQIHHRLWFCCDSFFTCIFLCSFRHRFETVNGTEMGDVEQTQKIVSLITCEISLCQYVCEFFFGVNVFDLDLGELCGFWKHVSL